MEKNIPECTAGVDPEVWSHPEPVDYLAKLLGIMEGAMKIPEMDFFPGIVITKERYNQCVERLLFKEASREAVKKALIFIQEKTK